MEYNVAELAKLAGVSARTLRYYDKIGLLVPKRSGNSYRVYGQDEVDTLQQILFYRELGVALDEIKRLIKDAKFDSRAALSNHLRALTAKRERLDQLIANVEKTINASKGVIEMSDSEKFEGFVQGLIDENERVYGDEVRAKYGGDALTASNNKLKGMTQEQYEAHERLNAELNETLAAACAQGDPNSDLAQKACALHKEWLCHYWATYSKEAHLGLAQMYVDDPRFAAYYEKIAPGCAVFLRDALTIYCK